MFINLKGDIIKDKMLYTRRFPVWEIVGFLYGVVVMIIGFVTAPEGGILFLAGTIMCIFGYISYMKACATYKLCKDGIWVKYPLESEQLIYWEDFHQVFICNQNCRRGQYVLCAFIRIGEEFNPQRGADRQSILKMRRTIIVDYTDELYEDIKKYSPYEIKDIRKPIKKQEYTGIR